VLNFGNELGGENVDLLVGTVQQAQCPDLVCGGRVVSGSFGFLAAVSGLKCCDFGGLRVNAFVSLMSSLLGLSFPHPRALSECIIWGMAHLFPVVQTLVVVLEHGAALLLAGVVFSRGVDDVAGEHVLPEGKAS